MAVLLNADTGAVSGISGLTTTADNSGILQFQSSGTATLTITTAGNVGIGTASPATKLDVNGAVTATSVNTQNTFGFKNRIINGAMVIDQRNAGASVTNVVGTIYSVDRWAAGGTQASKFSIQQNAGSVTPPVGFTNYLGATSLSAYSVVSSDFLSIQQRIEGFNLADLGWGTADAQTVTISFWARSSLTGTFGGSVYNSAGNRSYPFTYTITSANTWEKKSVTIAGDTSGTWLTNNGIGLFLGFSLGSGSTYSGTAGAWASSLYTSATGATSVVGTNGATLYITGVQLEKGSTATSFDYRPYGTELALCQRYYQQYDASESAAAGAGSIGVVATGSIGVMSGMLPVAMRATATVGFNNLVLNYGAATVGVSSITTYSAQKALGMDITASSSPMTVGRACVLQFSGGQSSANKITYSAEL
jgi:hypothetical protein